MYRSYMKNHQALVAVLLFLILYITIHLGQPDFLYNRDGSIRQFGVGYKNKTIFPAWLMAIILGILCYLFINIYTC
jgi:uncharacterized membrane protein YozB (DUF420 family)